MVRCFACGGPLRLVREGLYRCYVCGQLNQDRGGRVLPPTMKVYPSVEGIREAAVEGIKETTMSAPSEGGLDPDMAIFVDRVSERLIPTEGYRSDIKEKLLRSQNDVKRGLVDVFEGRAKFEDWYAKTRTNLGKNSMEMDEMIYTSLEGLRSPGAVELRMMFEQKLQRGLMR